MFEVLVEAVIEQVVFVLLFIVVLATEVEAFVLGDHVALEVLQAAVSAHVDNRALVVEDRLGDIVYVTLA